MIDYGRMKGEDSLNANPKARFSYSDGFPRTPVLARYHNTLESLQSFFGFGFFDPNVHANSIARLKPWNVVTQLRLFNAIQSIHFNCSSSRAAILPNSNKSVSSRSRSQNQKLFQ